MEKEYIIKIHILTEDGSYVKDCFNFINENLEDFSCNHDLSFDIFIEKKEDKNGIIKKI